MTVVADTRPELRLPRPLRDVVLRPRLFDLLDDGTSDRALTLVSAPPGSGKTVLLTSWLRERPAAAPTVWLGLREGGRASLWGPVLDAVGRTSRTRMPLGLAEPEARGRRRLRRPLHGLARGARHAARARRRRPPQRLARCTGVPRPPASRASGAAPGRCLVEVGPGARSPRPAPDRRSGRAAGVRPRLRRRRGPGAVRALRPRGGGAGPACGPGADRGLGGRAAPARALADPPGGPGGGVRAARPRRAARVRGTSPRRCSRPRPPRRGRFSSAPPSWRHWTASSRARSRGEPTASASSTGSTGTTSSSSACPARLGSTGIIRSSARCWSRRRGTSSATSCPGSTSRSRPCWPGAAARSRRCGTPSMGSVGISSRRCSQTTGPRPLRPRPTRARTRSSLRCLDRAAAPVVGAFSALLRLVAGDAGKATALLAEARAAGRPCPRRLWRDSTP